jgi:hypothetical protein
MLATAAGKRWLHVGTRGIPWTRAAPMHVVNFQLVLIYSIFLTKGL